MTPESPDLLARRAAQVLGEVRTEHPYGRFRSTTLCSMTVDNTFLARDLIRRTEQAAETVARLAVDTGVTFTIEDIVDTVERGLPVGYAVPTTGDMTRRDVIAQMAQDILSGEMYGT